MRIKNGLPKYCTWNIDRENGKKRVRLRVRRRGIDVYLTGTPWSEDFMRQRAAALDGCKTATAVAGVKRTVAGSINALIVSYYESVAFKRLKPSTQANRRNILERFRESYGDLPVSGLTRAVLGKIMGDRSNTPMAANNLLKVLGYLMDHAIGLGGLITVNPTIGITRYRGESEGHHTWTDEEVAAFKARHPVGSRARLALALLLYTGQRRGDVTRMGWQHITGDLITVRQEKTSTPLMIPLHPDLMQALQALPRSNLTFLMTERGAPFTSAGFGNWFRDRCNEAGLPHCSAHGLRHAAATGLANIGCTDEQIMAITGHRSRASLAVYTRGADQVRLARQAMAKLIETEDEQKMVQHAIGLDQNRRK